VCPDILKVCVNEASNPKKKRVRHPTEQMILNGLMATVQLRFSNQLLEMLIMIHEPKLDFS
jgi:hypothetical protein